MGLTLQSVAAKERVTLIEPELTQPTPSFSVTVIVPDPTRLSGAGIVVNLIDTPLRVAFDACSKASPVHSSRTCASATIDFDFARHRRILTRSTALTHHPPGRPRLRAVRSSRPRSAPRCDHL